VKTALPSLTVQLKLERDQLDAELQKYVRMSAIVFVDIVGSTSYYEKHGDLEGFVMVQRFFRMLTPLVEEHHGAVVKTIGDAILARFATAEEGVRCTIAMQRAMARRTNEKPEEHQIRIRAGVNIGMVVVRQDDVFGDVVNAASRIINSAAPDEILISPAVYDEVQQLPGIPVSKKAAGVELKGKAERMDLYEVMWRQEEKAIVPPPRPSAKQVGLATGFHKDIQSLWDNLKMSGGLKAPSTAPPSKPMHAEALSLALVRADGTLAQKFSLAKPLVLDAKAQLRPEASSADGPISEIGVARFTQKGDEVLVEDTGIPGGVFMRLTQVHTLVEGDTVIVGRQRMCFQPVPKPCMVLTGARDEELDRFPLDSPSVSFGRSRATHVFAKDHFMSGSHARIYQGPSGFVLEDLNSTNGTFLRIRPSTNAKIKSILLAGEQFLQVVAS